LHPQTLRSFCAAIPKGALFPEMGNKTQGALWDLAVPVDGERRKVVHEALAVSRDGDLGKLWMGTLQRKLIMQVLASCSSKVSCQLQRSKFGCHKKRNGGSISSSQLHSMSQNVFKNWLIYLSMNLS
jgi:hypothetical protein